MEFSLVLERTAYTQEQLILGSEVQIALAGRSNVGKSSLINALSGSDKVAKTSSTPGKTRSVNYYLVRPYNFYLVDSPGYGYARASHAERREWASLLDDFFVRNDSLKCLAILLDGRLSPQKNDLDMIAYAKHLGMGILPVLTKADNVRQADWSERVKEWTAILGYVPIITSSSKKRGIKELCRKFLEIATQNTNAEADNTSIL